MSSFLGIGGGPINLVVLGFCFGMDTKTAAANSLYTILFSQIASLLTTLVTGCVLEFRALALALMFWEASVAASWVASSIGRWTTRQWTSCSLA